MSVKSFKEFLREVLSLVPLDEPVTIEVHLTTDQFDTVLRHGQNFNPKKVGNTENESIVQLTGDLNEMKRFLKGSCNITYKDR
jgi:hypothetical protein